VSEDATTEVILLKLGGSLITDKRRPDTVRSDVLERLAAEISEALGAARTEGGTVRLVLGHGSGSYGHAAAARYGVHQGLGSPEQTADRLPGIPATQERAAALHRLVLDALTAESLVPFSIAPSSALVAASGRPVRFAAEPVALALRAGLLPVVYGDLVMDREQGCAICSTETVFLALSEALAEHGFSTARALWAGATPGVLDAAGRTIEKVAPEDADDASAAAREAAGTDVTGGMAHRLDAALALARRGVPSLIFDATVPGNVAAALRGLSVPGTRVAARASFF
jgi:isopentenyl phosphate kinase